MWSATFSLCGLRAGLLFCLLQPEEAPDMAGFSSDSACTSGPLKWSLSSNHSDPVPCPRHINCYHCFTEKSWSGSVSGLGLMGKQQKANQRTRDGQPDGGKPLGLLVNSGLALNSLRDAGIHGPLYWMFFMLQSHSNKRRAFYL